MTGDPLFLVDQVSKRYGMVTALAPLSLTIRPGETVAIIGPSGSGKTTLLHILGGIIAPDGGAVQIAGRPLARLKPGRELASLVGIMHQQYDLVPSLSVVHNVLAGRLGQWGTVRSLVSLISPRERERAFNALDRVGIGDKLYERTSNLSGGEQQRVALARLLLQNPLAILADEPVSSVDPARAEDVIRMLVGIAHDGRQTLIVSLHSVSLARRYFSRIIALRGGAVLFDLPAGLIGEEHFANLYALPVEAAG